MFPRGRKIDQTRCPIGLDEAQEFWLGPGAQGSVFGSREELLAAWARGRPGYANRPTCSGMV